MQCDLHFIPLTVLFCIHFLSNFVFLQDICANSCLFTNMYFGPPVTGVNGAERKDYAWGVFYFRRDVKTTTEYLLYSILSMLAEIGGWVGLLIGASLVNISKVNGFLLDLCFYRKSKEENENNKSEKEDAWKS